MGVWTPGSGATAGDDVFVGDGADETANAGAGHDTLSGNGGNDILSGGAGDDTIDGGAGDDIVGGENATASDSISTGNDTLSGGDGNDYIVGGMGNDILNGGDGNDTLFNGIVVMSSLGGWSGVGFSYASGNDTLDGGAGSDNANLYYFDRTSAISLTVNAPNVLTQVLVNGVAEGSFINIEYLTFYSGSGNDFFDLTGFTSPGGSAAAIDGGDGADTIISGDRSDSLWGGAGDDTIQGNGGNDFIRGGAGADILSGGDGRDTLSYEGGTLGVTVNLALQAASGGDAQGDTISGFEDVYGTFEGDTLTGDDGANTLYGRQGDDHLFGGAGNDALGGEEGTDELVGGAGDDVYYVGDALDTVTELASEGNDRVFVSSLVSYTLAVNVERLIYEGSGAFTGTGNALDNEFSANSGAQTFEGLAGNDILYGGLGNDTLDGGADNDTAAYYNASYIISSGVSVSLAIVGAQNTGSHGVDTLIGIENLIGTNFNDFLTGDSGANVIEGMHGSNDTLDGGGGVDTVSFARHGFGVTVSLALQGGFQSTTSSYGVTLSNFENVIGSNFDDVINGDAGDNTLTGGAGNDLLVGAGGADTLIGGAGNDTYSIDAADTIIEQPGEGTDTVEAGFTYTLLTNFENLSLTGSSAIDGVGNAAGNVINGNSGANVLSGLQGDDTIQGGEGADTIDGGDGVDTLSFVSALAGVNANLASSTGSAGEAAGDTYANMENIRGSAFDDVLWGDLNANTIWGGDGNDQIFAFGVALNFVYGEAGDDTLSGWGLLDGGDGDDLLYMSGVSQAYGGAGADTFVMGLLMGAGVTGVVDGGDGIDTWSFADTRGTAVLSTGMFYGSNSSGTYTLVSIENLRGGNFVDELHGDDNANHIWGGGSHDRLEGHGGNDILEGEVGLDVLLGQDGDDQLLGGDGDDTLVGGAGADVLDGGAGSDTAVFQSAAVSVNLTTGSVNGGDATFDTLISIENISGSSFDDVVFGDGGTNYLYGNGGNDTLDGAGGTDSLQGGAGADILRGGEGIDNAAYSSSTAGVNVNLATGAASGGDAAGDTFNSIEGLFGSAYADVLTGDGGANRIGGSGGNDTLSGGGGNDNINGGTGGDTLNGEDGDDILKGDDGSDTLNGGDGDDILDGGYHGDTLIGGAGTDTVDYSMSEEYLAIVDLQAGAATDGASFTDTLNSIENAIGSEFADTIVGSTIANTLMGGDGNDNLQGVGGDDILWGGLGDDQINGGLGADTIDGGDGFDTVRYDGAASGVIIYVDAPHANTGEAAGDVLTSIEGFVGSTFNDYMVGGVANNVLQGFSGADVLEGHGGDDLLDGGDGDDNLNGGLGGDILDGGAGFDVARYDGATSGVTIYVDAAYANQGEAAGDFHLSIEGIVGSFYNDYLVGGVANNILQGYFGDDILEGHAGDDLLDGGDGNDQLNGGTGGDIFEGGAGFDTVRYDSATAGVIAFMTDAWANTGEAAGDAYLNIEALYGSNFNDTLAGASNSNELQGFDGTDFLYGYGGNDFLGGGAGNDFLEGGAGVDGLRGDAGNDQFIFRAGEATGDRIFDFAGNGAAAGDNLLFIGYGSAAAGATFVQIDATHWQINSADGLIHDIITIVNGASIDATDYIFGGG